MPRPTLTATPDTSPSALAATADTLLPGTYPGATTYPGADVYPGRGNDLIQATDTPKTLTATVDN